MSAGFEVVKAGLQATLQDWPGRIGYWRVGIPPSGPMDSLSFRLANLLVGNPAGATALEFQFVGPHLRALKNLDVAVVGGDSTLTVDGRPAPANCTFIVSLGQTIDCGALRTGARGYLAVAGGFAKEPVLGSAATFPRGGVGGTALAVGQLLAVEQPSAGRPRLELRGDAVPSFANPAVIEVTAGPHFDWLGPDGRAALLGGRWKVSPRSDRTGIRLSGPKIGFSARALHKAPENGPDPTNVINTGYPVGGVNLCGDTPIILPVDGPSQGGFITPLVVVSAALHKVGQLRPNQDLVFRRVSIETAIDIRRSLETQLLQSVVPATLAQVEGVA